MKQIKHVLTIMLIGLLYVGCKKESVQPIDKKKTEQNVELSNLFNSKNPIDAGWTDKSNKVRPSVKDALTKAFDKAGIKDWAYTTGSHIEEGPIMNVELNKKLGPGYKEVREKNAVITTVKDGLNFAELRYYQNAKGEIRDLTTKYGRDTKNGKNAYLGPNFKKDNGNHYDPLRIPHTPGKRYHFGHNKNISDFNHNRGIGSSSSGSGSANNNGAGNQGSNNGANDNPPSYNEVMGGANNGGNE